MERSNRQNYQNLLNALKILPPLQESSAFAMAKNTFFSHERRVKTLFLICVVVGIPLLILATIYNGFISRRNAMRNAFSSIDVQLRRRWDLIPNLVETVKGFAQHEKEIFESITKARSAAQSLPANTGLRAEQEVIISQGVDRLLAVAEDYPELKSSEHFLNLQRNLTEIESQISASRRAYNAAVQAWNNGVETVPGSLFANLWNFESADWFEVQHQERASVNIEL